MLAKIQSILEEIFIKSWWVILFALFCHMLYEQGLKKRDREFAKLYSQLQELKTQKKEALSLQENLILQVNSQSDPEWVELILMKGLGVVPEGDIKILFKKENSSSFTNTK